MLTGSPDVLMLPYPLAVAPFITSLVRRGAPPWIARGLGRIDIRRSCRCEGARGVGASVASCYQEQPHWPARRVQVATSMEEKFTGEGPRWRLPFSTAIRRSSALQEDVVVVWARAAGGSPHRVHYALVISNVHAVIYHTWWCGHAERKRPGAF